MLGQIVRIVLDDRQFADIMGNMTEIDETDRLLLAELSQNARLPVAKLAARLGLARTTVQARLERLERSGVIAGYTLRLSDQVQRQSIKATVLVQIRPAALPGVLTHLKKMPAVEAVHTTSGRFDLCCLLRTNNTLDLDSALDQIGEIDGVILLESLIHLSTRIDRTV